MTARDAATALSPACSRQWDEASQPVWGTAAVARFWIALEQPGPWGLDALTQSRLDPQLARELDHRCHHHGGRLVLIRRPVASHPDVAGPRALYVAHSGPRPWLAVGQIDDPADLLTLPFHKLGTDAATTFDVSARLPGLARTGAGVVLVCTNGKRDVCCAVRGRPVALQAAAQRPDLVWECSHTGGHRFAPTGVVLPFGHTVAGLDAASTVRAVDAAGHGRLEPTLLGPRHDRGPSALIPPLQAAVAWTRSGLAGGGIVETDPRALSAEFIDDDGALVLVRHTNGSTWRVRVTERPYDRPLKNSCAKAAGPVSSWLVTEETP